MPQVGSTRQGNTSLSTSWLDFWSSRAAVAAQYLAFGMQVAVRDGRVLRLPTRIASGMCLRPKSKTVLWISFSIPQAGEGLWGNRGWLAPPWMSNAGVTSVVRTAVRDGRRKQSLPGHGLLLKFNTPRIRMIGLNLHRTKNERFESRRRSSTVPLEQSIAMYKTIHAIGPGMTKFGQSRLHISCLCRSHSSTLYRCLCSSREYQFALRCVSRCMHTGRCRLEILFLRR